jgi:NAD(P)-dependent dehydrogenase (short-subunit alcohol dehydrogenase family)
MNVLQGKAGIVTGAGRGLGRAYAMALAAAGARVVVNDIDQAEAEAVVGEIRAAGGTALANADDVGNWQAAARMAAQCAKEFGGIDVVVNNAGITRAMPIWKEDEASFDLMVSANLKGTFAVTRHALDYMLPKRSGSIINVSSGAQAGVAERSVYGATKGGVSSATYIWAMELAEHGIRVNAISPMAETRMSPKPLPPGAVIPPLRRPENIAPLAVYLASDAASWVTGQIFRLGADKLSLFGHPRALHVTPDPRGWTLEALNERLRAEFGHKLEPVGVTATEYIYGR